VEFIIIEKAVTKECISKASLLINLPIPSLPNPESFQDLWQREARRDLIINDFILTKEFIRKATHPHPCPLPSRERELKNCPSLEGRG
jgi:hypothetical protein